MPSRSEAGQKTSWTDDLEPVELIVLFVIVAIALSCAYAWARPLIQSTYLLVGGLGVGITLTLLISSLVARVLGGVRLLLVFLIALTVFSCTAALPWVIDGADYPFKDYAEVLRLVGAKPLDVPTLYGSTGVLFLLYQLAGVILVGFAAVVMLAVVGAAILGASAALTDSLSAGLAGFRRKSFGLSLVCIVISAFGVWVTTGGLFRLTEQTDAYARDQQRPHIFDASLRGRGTERTLRFRLDEPARVLITVSGRSSARKPRWSRNSLPSGLNKRAVTVPRTSPRSRIRVILRARDRAGHLSGRYTLRTMSARRRHRARGSNRP